MSSEQTIVYIKPVRSLGEWASTKGRFAAVWRKVKRQRTLLIMVVPVVIWYVIFKYIPMIGLMVSFTDWGFQAEISWVGVENFQRLFRDPIFYRAFFNTLIISGMYILFYFPLPILLSILLNEIGSMKFKRTVQFIVIVPYFFSWVVIGGLFQIMLSPEGGIVNEIITAFGGRSIFFFVSNDWFRWVLTSSYIWWHLGYGAVIYIATLATIDPQLYDAAKVDGANRIQQVFYVTLPSLKPTIAVMLLLTIASVTRIFEQVLIMYNAAVYESAEVLRTYAYKTGILNGDIGFSTAVSLFTSVVTIAIILGTNWTSKKFLDQSIF